MWFRDCIMAKASIRSFWAGIVFWVLEATIPKMRERSSAFPLGYINVDRSVTHTYVYILHYFVTLIQVLNICCTHSSYLQFQHELTIPVYSLFICFILHINKNILNSKPYSIMNGNFEAKQYSSYLVISYRLIIYSGQRQYCCTSS